MSIRAWENEAIQRSKRLKEALSDAEADGDCVKIHALVLEDIVHVLMLYDYFLIFADPASIERALTHYHKFLTARKEKNLQ